MVSTRYTIFFFLLILATSCGEDPKQQADTPVIVDAPVDTKEDAPVQTTAAKESTKGTIATVEGNGPGLNLWVTSGKVALNGEICLQVSASGIDDVISMQYSMRWDPKVLAFKKIKNFNLSTLDENDFGLNRVKEGLLTSVWIEDGLQGIDLRKKIQIYDVCFTAIGAVGGESSVRFWSTPTPFESVVLPETVVTISTHKGVVTIEQ